MPDVQDFFDSATLLGVLNEIQPSESYTWYGKVPTRPVDGAGTVEWEVEYGEAQEIAEFNSPGGEANLVGFQGRAWKSGALFNIREKKQLEGFVERWTRKSATANERQNASAFVAKELKSLHTRASNAAEWACWKALSGVVPVHNERLSAEVEMGFKASHQVTATTAWANATIAQIRADIEALKELIEVEGNVAAQTIYVPSNILAMVLEKFADKPELMTPEMKSAYYNGDVVRGFMGLDWTTVRKTYDVRNAAYAKSRAFYMPQDTLFIGNYTENSPIEILEGGTDDLNFADNATGWHARSWVNNDPGYRTILGEYRFLPIITRPDQMATLKIA